MNVIAEKKVKTRKVHKCWGCLDIIPIGVNTMRVTSVECGEIASVYWCARCEKFLSTLDTWQQEDGFVQGELKNFEDYPK